MLGLWVHWCTGAIYYLVVDVVCGWQTWFPDSCSITTLMWCQIKHSGRENIQGIILVVPMDFGVTLVLVQGVAWSL